jgi:hypothetical protein
MPTTCGYLLVIAMLANETDQNGEISKLGHLPAVLSKLLSVLYIRPVITVFIG